MFTWPWTVEERPRWQPTEGGRNLISLLKESKIPVLAQSGHEEEMSQRLP